MLRRLRVLIQYQDDPAREAGLTISLAGGELDPWDWEKKLHWILAYLGRYGRIPAETVMHAPHGFVRGLMQQVGELLKAEATAGKQAPLSAAARDEWL